MTSRTRLALRLVDGGLTAYQAAKAAGINPATLYRAINARQGRQCCPTCGQTIRITTQK